MLGTCQRHSDEITEIEVFNPMCVCVHVELVLYFSDKLSFSSDYSVLHYYIKLFHFMLRFFNLHPVLS